MLELLARHRAIVLCGHLHRYSVVRRSTSHGPVVQIMAVSVVKDRSYLVPDSVITTYGPSLAETKPEWQPETLEVRKAMLKEESRYVTYYKQTDLPGYALLKMNESNGELVLEYYAAFGEKPFDTIDLSALIKS